MTIRTIEVSASRTFNHPTERFANFNFGIRLQADLAAGDDPDQCLAQLQKEAEHKAESHKAAILADIERKAEIAATLDAMKWHQSKAREREDSADALAELEAKLSALTAAPLLLALPAQLHPGHPDHPETFEDPSYDYRKD